MNSQDSDEDVLFQQEMASPPADGRPEEGDEYRRRCSSQKGTGPSRCPNPSKTEDGAWRGGSRKLAAGATVTRLELDTRGRPLWHRDASLLSVEGRASTRTRGSRGRCSKRLRWCQRGNQRQGAKTPWLPWPGAQGFRPRWVFTQERAGPAENKRNTVAHLLSISLKGHGNEADFLGLLQKLGPHRSLTVPFEPFRFWLQIRGDIRNWKTTPRLSESGSRLLNV